MDGQQMPTLSLLRDLNLSKNSLNAFLNIDIGVSFSELIGVQEASIFSQESLKLIAERAIASLEKADNVLASWLRFHAVVGDLPPYEDIVAQFKTIIRKTNFIDLYKTDVYSANIVLVTASQQLINFSDQDLRCFIKDQLLRTIELFSEWDNENISENNSNEPRDYHSQDTWIVLLETMLNISLAAKSTENVASEFKDLLSLVVDRWHSKIPEVRNIVQRFCEELPISQAKQFWPLLVRLRAE